MAITQANSFTLEGTTNKRQNEIWQKITRKDEETFH